ncbi:PREDICTED: uncharacterized protein LOC109580536 [Amphimedon queenslandica]|uniref:G-protein coupled receptors family 2 profile 2 domain-containing protein n=2 Tax=Amphimedon queenslandica TaxID=400682 RepID=A0AAN0IX76_AMPQE|nr:PREDICTED: uncharacterized protein LOC109580536 [Amphimedon queenslandica]|eukprot:XP_019849369.1 PREDICTED: uncharacterized protein LOC109580536 [Amphimedon queenslandica]
MGIAWVGNVLFFRKELLFIAYIMTVFIAAQGIIIFILYVLLSKQVRAVYSKWWKDKKANSQFFSIFTSKALFPFRSADQAKDFGTHSNSNHNEASLNEKCDEVNNKEMENHCEDEYPSPIVMQDSTLANLNEENEETDSDD